MFRNAKRNSRRKENVSVRRVGKKAGDKINVRME
jgi:hypothetical protein